ncbi:MAG: polyphosphate kinase 1 [Ignavibacteriae bacterium]|nr:polyphosphate kinase 1 [Ignavibacteriota bacterium]NOG97206.1 polyphosphate kinase 1 [Ignavibacteriota bacterium]
MKIELHNRELSWLSFNYRVLQEAKDKSVPLYERIKFLAIYSSNLDEFFRVRVASLRSLLSLKKKTQSKLKFDPDLLLKSIHKTVNEQQEEFGEIFRNEILVELKENNIYLLNENNVSEDHKLFAINYFEENIKEHIQPILLIKNKIKPFLKNSHLYLAVKIKPKNRTGRVRHTYALVEIPANTLPRFIKLPSKSTEHNFIFLDDVIRISLDKIFPDYEIVECSSVKLTRDAELYIDDEFTGNLLSKIQKGIKKRNTGVPSRFLYDNSINKSFLSFIKEALELENDDMVAGGKYHNFNDFFTFPNPLKPKLENPAIQILEHSELKNIENIFDAISTKDFGLHFPYQSYSYVVDFINKAADDEKVKEIKITQYRVAKDSKIVEALIRAARNGKDVMAFVELKARFDEEQNIHWAEQMEKNDVKVYYSFPGLKVHAKIAMVVREENNVLNKYCYLGTGNFNEKTAKIYSDFGLLTKDERITNEVSQVFDFLSGNEQVHKFKHLLVAQFNMRKQFLKLIQNEIDAAAAGGKGKIVLKMNSIEDKKMIRKLYEASNAGVEIKLIVRGICCLVPGVKGMSENIKVISIIDKYLEHSRFYIFHNNGNELIYAASADWMRRNLSRRIEVGFPIYQQNIRDEILKMIEIQLNDNCKARIIDTENSNEYVSSDSNNIIRSQVDFYEFLKNSSSN